MASQALRFFVLIFFISFVHCRILSRHSSSEDLISDGISGVTVITSNVSISSTNTCDHIYGFLPCAENTGGYIFQILIYQGLIMFGEKELSTGSRVLFNTLATSNIVGIIFRIVVGLPSILIMIVSGVFSSKEEAQSKVSLGVGIYAGITVFTLTMQWGMCVIFGRRKLPKESVSDHTEEEAPTTTNFSLAKVVSNLKDTGVTIDNDTHRIAGFMLLSLIPYIIIQLVDVLKKKSFESHVVILMSLVISSTMLLLYLVYQVMNPWMQEKSLAYTKYETLRKGFLQHMQKHGKLIDEHGNLNVPLIRNLFSEADKDANKAITKGEMQRLVQDFINAGKMKVDDQIVLSEAMEVFDFNRDGTINYEEFADGCGNLITKTNQTTKISDTSLSIPKLPNDQKKEADPKDGNNVIDEPEFINGKVNKSLPTAEHDSDEKRSADEIHKIVKEKVLNGESLAWTLIKSVLQVLLGIVSMTYLGGPLTTSILQLSNSMNAPSFMVSFLVVPLAMNCRAAIAALSPASHKSEKTASLTFSEIYGGVVMSNISNLTALLAMVYAKDLTWDYSAEVLTVLVVCAIIGFLAYSRTSYPLWTCLLAFLLYPFSLGLFYYAQYVLRWN